MVWAKANSADEKYLVIALSAYSAIAYYIVGHFDYPILRLALVQIVFAVCILMISVRLSSNNVGYVFVLMILVAGISLAGNIPNKLWQGFSFNYWNIHAILWHIALAISWIQVNDTTNFKPSIN